MSRSGYSDDCENFGLWRGAVEKSIKGKRGQAFLKEMLEALDALPEKKLVANNFKTSNGEVCALGSVGAKRAVDMGKLEEAEPDEVGKAFGISMAMAAEIMHENDEGYSGDWRVQETPENRFNRIRSWVVSNLNKTENA